MPFNDGIDRRNCFSITDFHTFEYCPFKFFVSHHLQKKYELEEGSEQMALGSLLDESIKKFHISKAYGLPGDYLPNLVKASCNEMKAKVLTQKGPSFFSAMEKFLTDELCEKASKIFQDYYLTKNQKINYSIGKVDFCELVLEQNGQRYKLWGWPDAFEIDANGVVEIVDYKSREDVEKGKENMDMDLMPKLYVLLCSKKLMEKGYKKAKFVVKFWQDPRDESFFEEFDLAKIGQFEQIFKDKILEIVNTKELRFCEKPFCKACNSERRKEFLDLLKVMEINESLVENLSSIIDTEPARMAVTS